MAELERHISVWNECLRIFEQNVDPKQFSVWFKTIVPVSLEGSTLTVEVPTDFFRSYLEDAYLPIIKLALRRVIGPEAKLMYKIHPVRREAPMVFTAAHGNVPENKSVMLSTFQASSNPGPFVFPGLQKVKINPRLNPAYCFENMVKGECNKMGINAGVNISDKPGKTPFNPLFVFGGPGLGKTHLAQAIGIAIHDAYPDLIVLYVTGNEFKTQYMNAVHQNKLADFMAYYMRIDVLIVDDIHELVGPASQNAFFNIFNHLHQSGKQLVFTSDRAPVDLMNFEERLLSRFKWGLSVELERPDMSTRLAMLKARCAREGVSVDESVLELLASKIRSNFRELEGALISLIASATLCHEEITMELAQKVTGNIVSEEREDVTMDKVQDVVCEYFNITRETLLSKSRKRNIVQARQIAMYLSRNLIGGCSLSTIGMELGGKDHATVLHACNTVSDLMSTDKLFRQYVSDIERMLVPVAR
ncbi:MAG: chromosomal replication initiator protein DnaA [Bacteroidales bacterium]|nr:chromosomal replication initiator protein DnaA [Bacteroidales bacterium]MBQ6283927.1 chromosomal replication initiator protein DnaA [Bacteroidales bacterium]